MKSHLKGHVAAALDAKTRRRSLAEMAEAGKRHVTVLSRDAILELVQAIVDETLARETPHDDTDREQLVAETRKRLADVLKRQGEADSQILGLKETLLETEGQVLALERERNALRGQLETASQALDESRAKLTETQALFAQASEREQDRRRRAEEQDQEQRVELEQTRGRLAAMEEERRLGSSREARLEERCTSLEKQVESMRDRLNAKDVEERDALAGKDDEWRRIVAAQEQDHRETLAAQTDQWRTTLASKDELVRAAEDAARTSDQQLQAARDTLAAQEEELTRARTAAEQHETQLYELRETLAARETDLRHARERLDEMGQELDDARPLNAMQQQLDQMKAELSALGERPAGPDPQLLEALSQQIASSGEQAATGLEDRFQASLDKAIDEIDRTMRSATAKPLEAGPVESASVVLGELFETGGVVETNLPAEGPAEAVAGGQGISSSLGRLKALRGGGAPTVDDGATASDEGATPPADQAMPPADAVALPSDRAMPPADAVTLPEDADAPRADTDDTPS